MDRLLEATARAERDHFWFRGFRTFVEPLIAEASHARPLQILDCGCGTGHNLTMLRRYGRASGIDLAWAGLPTRAPAVSGGSRAQPRRGCRSRTRRSISSPRSTSCIRSMSRRSAMRSPRCSGCSGPGDGWSSPSQRSMRCAGDTTGCT